MERQIVVICGPTAVGKTKYAIEAAKALDGEVVSCDSMQLYKYMDIGSAKPTPEEQAQVKHHLVDCIDPREEFSAAVYAKLGREAIEDIFSRGKTPIIAGGTGLYLNALLYDLDFSSPSDEKLRGELYAFAEEHGSDALYARLQEKDPAAAARVHPNNVFKVVRALEVALLGTPLQDFRSKPQRTKDYDAVLCCLNRERPELYERINLRVDLLMEQGLLDEIRGLMDMGLTEDHISMKGIGYKELIGYLHGEYDLEEAVRLIKRNTRHLAKRQLTWFRRYDDMKWFNISEYPDDEHCIKEMNQWLKASLNK